MNVAVGYDSRQHPPNHTRPTNARCLKLLKKLFKGNFKDRASHPLRTYSMLSLLTSVKTFKHRVCTYRVSSDPHLHNFDVMTIRWASPHLLLGDNHDTRKSVRRDGYKLIHKHTTSRTRNKEHYTVRKSSSDSSALETALLSTLLFVLPVSMILKCGRCLKICKPLFRKIIKNDMGGRFHIYQTTCRLLEAEMLLASLSVPIGDEDSPGVLKAHPPQFACRNWDNRWVSSWLTHNINTAFVRFQLSITLNPQSPHDESWNIMQEDG